MTDPEILAQIRDNITHESPAARNDPVGYHFFVDCEEDPDGLFSHEPHDVACVRRFHLDFGVPSRSPAEGSADLRLYPKAERDLRQRLITEEALGQGEMLDSLRKGDRVGVADGIADVLYVAAGTEVQLGLIRPTLLGNTAQADAVAGLLGVAMGNLRFALQTTLDVSSSDILAQALLQLRIICNGLGMELAIPVRAVFDEVHRSNMSKKNADGSITRDAGGKIIKSPHYSPADIEGVLAAFRTNDGCRVVQHHPV